MQLSTEVRRAEYILLALQFITAIVGIWLLSRTSPVVDRILAENVDSLESVRGMHRGLTEFEAGIGEGRDRFEESYARASHNITELEEEEVLAAIRVDADALFEGRIDALDDLEIAMDELSQINRNSMEQASLDAKALANAGAWSLVGLAITSIITSFVFVRRTNDRIVAPVHHLHDVATSYERGEHLRRCEKFGMPDELRFVAETMNRLLDAEVRRKKHEDRRASSGESICDQSLLEAMLQMIPNAQVMLDADGAPIACTASSTPRLRQVLADARDTVETPTAHGLEVLTLPGDRKLIRQREAPSS